MSSGSYKYEPHGRRQPNSVIGSDLLTTDPEQIERTLESMQMLCARARALLEELSDASAAEHVDPILILEYALREGRYSHEDLQQLSELSLAIGHAASLISILPNHYDD
jgi:hypothetical protein